EGERRHPRRHPPPPRPSSAIVGHRRPWSPATGLRLRSTGRRGRSLDLALGVVQKPTLPKRLDRLREKLVVRGQLPHDEGLERVQPCPEPLPFQAGAEDQA